MVIYSLFLTYAVTINTDKDTSQPFEPRIKSNQNHLLMKNTKQPTLRRQNCLFRGALSSALICLFGAAGAQAAYIPTAADGAWEDTATWSGGTIPDGDDYANVTNGNYVTLSSVVSIGQFATDNAGVLTVNSGGSLTSTAGSNHPRGGTIDVQTGGSVTMDGWMSIDNAAASNKAYAINVNGGSYNQAGQMYLGGAGVENSTIAVAVNSGSFQSGFIQLRASTDTTVTLDVNGGTATVDYLVFVDHTGTNTVTVDGGDLIISTSNENGSLTFASASDKVWYEDGTITWEGVDTEAEFNTFKATFSAWVYAGNMDSATFTDQQLRDQLIFDGTDAVLSDTLPPASADYIPSAADGAWGNTATWSGGKIPDFDDFANVNTHYVTLSSVVSIGQFATDNGGKLTVNSGGSLTSTAGFNQPRGGTIDVQTGGSVTMDGWMSIDNAAASNKAYAINVNGGSYNQAGQMYLGGAGVENSTIAVAVNSGSFQSGFIQLRASTDTTVTLDVNGGTATVDYLVFVDHSGTNTVTVDGGDLIVRTSNENGSLTFAKESDKIWYESGSIIWEGVDSQYDFDAFQATFNAWVDAGNITSSVYSAAELKYRLQFLGGDAVLSMAVVAFPAIDDPVVNLIANGDFLSVANKDDTLNPGAVTFNVNGTFGDILAFEGRTADVVGWAPYYEDPDGLIPAVGTPHLVDGNGELDGTWYLDTLIDTSNDSILLNSSMNYLNGMKQEDILNGVTIDSSATYRLAVRANYSDNGSDYSTSPFTVALTDGSGAAVTNPANAIAGGLLTGDLAFWDGVRSVDVSGAALLAAEQVNVIFDLESDFEIPGFPGEEPEAKNLSVTAQARVYSVALYEVFVQQLGDVNKDGQVDQSDVDLANSYLDGSIDGGDDTATRQADLVADGMTAAEALAYLKLTEFDFDGNNTFDAADIVVLGGLVSATPVIDSGSLDGSGNFVVQVSGLEIGTEYFLTKDTDLSDGAVFDVVADSVTATSTTETLTDVDAETESNQAFYQVTD